MNNRTVIVIVAVAVILFGFIYLVDTDSMSTDELKEREGRVFVEFKFDFVEAFSVQGSSGLMVSMVKNGDAAEGNVKWSIKTPRALKADESAVRSVLSALDFLLKGRSIKDAASVKDPKYGLDKPRLTGSFVMGGETTVFKIGGDDVSGEKVYLGVEGRDEIYAVEKDFLEALDKGISDLRDKRLIDETFSSAVAVVVKKKTTISIERDNPVSPWRIDREGQSVLAAGDQVSDLLQEVNSLRATSFVGDDVEDDDLSKKYGFTTETGSVTVTLEGGDKTDISFGGPCPEANNIYASVVGSKTVTCVSSQISTVLDRSATRFTETRLAVFQESDVEKITMTRAGKSLSIEKNAENDAWVLPKEDTDLDQTTVSALLKLITETRADSIAFGADATDALSTPTGTMEIALDSGLGKLTVHFYSQAEGEPLLARRGDEPAVLSINSTATLDSLAADALAFRNKTLNNVLSGDIVEIDISGPTAQKLIKTDDSWSLEMPLAIKADGAQVRSLVDKISSLKVVEFISNEASTLHGLSDPWVEISVKLVNQIKSKDDSSEELTQESVVTLQIGATAKNETRYARIKGKGGVVFTIGSDIISIISRPLVARDLLQVDAALIVKVELLGKNGTLTALLDGDNWKDESGLLDSVTLKRLLTDLSATRAVRADSFVPNASVKENTLTISLYEKDAGEDKAPTTIIFGSKAPVAKEDGYLVQRNGVPVSFVYPARIVDELLSLIMGTISPNLETSPDPQ